MYREKSCPNMNHSRSHSLVVFCPTCGKRLTAEIKRVSSCNEKHGGRRKSRDSFCIDCGLSLTTM